MIWEDVHEGDVLPEVRMPVTLKLCVHDAAATRDFFPGHHDRDYARSQNVDDVYLNTMFFHGFVDRVGGEWAGPQAWLARRRLDMVSPACVGDEMRTESKVLRRYEEDGRGLVDVEVRIFTAKGLGAKAMLTYALPQEKLTMQIENLEEEREMIRTFVRQLTTRYGRAYWVERAKADGTVEEMWQEMGRAGYLGVTIPEEYGGSGLSMQRLAILMEELSNEGVPLLFLVVSTAMASICIAKHGSEEQKQRYLPKLASGEEKFCFAITEPNAGSNSFKIQTIARREGDHYAVNGQKVFITGSDEADHMLLVARTVAAKEVSDKRQGMALFIVDPKSSGIEQQKIDTKILAPERQYQIFFDDVKIPVDARVGHDDLGLKPLFDALNPERIVIAAMGAGLGRYALGKAVEYGKTRIVFDRPIGSHQGLSHPLAIAKTHLELAALMTHEAARIFDAGGDAGMYANMAKYAAAEAAIEAVDAAIQVHGGMGFTGDVDVITLWPLVRLLRTAPVSREMVLNYVAEHVLGLPRSY